MIKSSCYIFHTKRNVKRSLRAWEKQRALTNNKCPLLPQKVEMLTANTKPSTSFKHYRTNCDSFSNVQIYVTLKRFLSNLLINIINIDHGIFLICDKFAVRFLDRLLKKTRANGTLFYIKRRKWVNLTKHPSLPTKKIYRVSRKQTIGSAGSA